MVNLNYNWLYLQLILFANFTDNNKLKNICNVEFINVISKVVLSIVVMSFIR